MRRMLFWGTAASSILAAAAAPAQTTGPAQTPDGNGSASAAEPPPLQEVVVSGVRRSLENAINTKRDADVVVDAISAEDVGKFPTENIAESLQRVTGVQISRFRGEGQNVTIRGLPPGYTLVELSGHTVANALGASGTNVSRNFDFTILPSEFVSKVEVFKTPSADMEEGGLAGTVIARTVRPLDVGRGAPARSRTSTSTAMASSRRKTRPSTHLSIRSSSHSTAKIGSAKPPWVRCSSNPWVPWCRQRCSTRTSSRRSFR